MIFIINVINLIITLAICIILKIQFFIKVINFLILIEKKNRTIKLILKFPNNVYKNINIFLRFIFANDQNEKFQFKNNKIKILKPRNLYSLSFF